jgi:hypothetical protein
MLHVRGLPPESGGEFLDFIIGDRGYQFIAPNHVPHIRHELTSSLEQAATPINRVQVYGGIFIVGGDQKHDFTVVENVGMAVSNMLQYQSHNHFPRDIVESLGVLDNDIDNIDRGHLGTTVTVGIAEYVILTLSPGKIITTADGTL